jgi:LPXTG-motif cell wall-anchored protein
VTTTAKSGNSGTTTATKTGDAGVGVAVAGLLLAAGTAVVAKKKKD